MISYLGPAVWPLWPRVGGTRTVVVQLYKARRSCGLRAQAAARLRFLKRAFSYIGCSKVLSGRREMTVEEYWRYQRYQVL
jgi:hypothetical protein